MPQDCTYIIKRPEPVQFASLKIAADYVRRNIPEMVELINFGSIKESAGERDGSRVQEVLDKFDMMTNTVEYVNDGNEHSIKNKENGQKYETVTTFLNSAVTEFVDGDGNQLKKQWILQFDSERWEKNTRALLEESNPTITDEEVEQYLNDHKEQGKAIQEIGNLFHNSADKYFSHIEDSENNKERKPYTAAEFYRNNGFLYNKLFEEYDDKEVRGKALSDSVFRILDNFYKHGILNDSALKMEGVTFADLRFRTEQVLIDNDGKFAGVADLEIIFPDGSVATVDWKLSQNDFGNWSPAKKIATAYQQLIYDRILKRNGLTTRGAFVLPIPISNAIDPSNVSAQFYTLGKNKKGLSDLYLRQITDAPSTNRIPQNIDSILPLKTAINPSLITDNENIRSFMKQVGDYEISSTIKSRDRDKAIQYALASKREFKNRTIYRVYNPIIVNAEPYVNLESQYDEEKDRKMIEAKVDEIMAIENQKMKALPERFRTSFLQAKNAIKRNQPPNFEWFSNNEKQQRCVENLFTKYLLFGNWDIISNDAMSDVGLLGFLNTDTNQMDLISLSTTNINARPKIEGDKELKTILGKFITDADAIRLGADKNITNADLEALKAYAFVKFNHEFFKDYSLGTVFTVGLQSATNIDESRIRGNLTYDMDNMWQILMKGTGSKLTQDGLAVETPQSKIKLPFQDWKVTEFDPVNSLMKYIELVIDKKINLRSYLSQTSEVMKNMKAFKKLEPDYISLKDKEALKGTLNSLYNSVYTFVNNRKDKHFTPSTEKALNQMLFLASQANMYVNNIPISLDRDATAWTRIQSPSKYEHIAMQHMVRITQLATNIAGEQHRKTTEESREAHATYYKSSDCPISIEKVRWIGDNIDGFMPLIQKTETGQNMMRFIDPDQLPDNGARQYVKWFCDKVWEVREARMRREWHGNATQSLDEMLEEAKRNHWLDIPLMRPGALSSMKQKTFKDAMDQFKHEIFNPNNLFTSDTDNFARQEQQTEMLNSFDIFEPYSFPDGNDQLRQNKLMAGDAVFELDLEAVFETYMMNAAKKEQFDRYLPVLNSLKTFLVYSKEELFHNQDKAAEQVMDYIDINAYNRTITPPEMQKLAEFINMGNKITAGVVLGFSPFSGITEMLQGTWSSISLTMTNYFVKEKDQFTFKNLTKAWEFIMGDALLRSTTAAEQNINMCDSMNEMYRLVDMDLYHQVEKGQLSYNSAANFTSKWMYWFSIFPNYFHRLSMFTAQMLKDGILKLDVTGNPTKDSAVQYINEKLVYDETKDERFKAYINAKEEPKDPEARKRYLEAKFKYDTLKESLIRDGYMKQGDKLTRWYDEKQRNSMVSFAGKALGDYESTLKTQFSKTVLGRAFGLFKTWMYAKRDKYWLTFRINEHQGKYVMQYDENGQPTHYVWTGKLMEGIAQTFGYIFQCLKNDIFTKEFSPSNFVNDMKGLNEQQRQNLILFTSDLILIAIISAIIAMLRQSDGVVSSAKNSYWLGALGAVDRSTQDLFIWQAMQSVAGSSNPFPALVLANNLLMGGFGLMTGDMYKAQKALNSFSLYRNFGAPISTIIKD